MQRRASRQRRRATKREGFALLIALVSLTILAVLVADLHETTGTSFAAAMAERDQLRAEYMAKSGVNLTRMVIAQERVLRLSVGQMFSMITGRRTPQLPVWQYANQVLKPFADFDSSKGDARSVGFDMDLSEGLGKTNGTFEVMATAENGKINLNDPHLSAPGLSQTTVANVFHSLMANPKFDVLFSSFDEKGRMNTRVDLVSNVVDWWDWDEQKTNYDPAMRVAQSSGGEDQDYYRSQLEPYVIKNAPLDTIEELRLVRGMTDDIWATFVEPDIEDPNGRLVTIYGGQNVNVNEAEPSVLLARVCAFNELAQQPLCSDPEEQRKFMNIFIMVRAIARIPIFGGRKDFVDFLTGKMEGRMGEFFKSMGSGGGLMSMLGGGGGTGAAAGGAQGGGSGWPFTPVVFPPQPPTLRDEMQRVFTTSSRFFTIEVTGRSGRSQRRIRAVINNDEKWTPPKPNAGTAPPLGVFAYYRIE